MVGTFPIRIALVAAIAAASVTGVSASPLVLITPDEASLPPPKGAVAMAARGVTRGPKIELASTPGTTSPVKISVKFQSFGGSTIDLESVKVVYLRASNVELTERVKRYITSGGIDLPEAQLPPGNHVVRVDLKDSDGRAATTSINLKVER